MPSVFRDIQKPDVDHRQYGLLNLSNSLKVLLVSDPETDKASAALDVNVGHLNDPDELPGLAHFLEHLLFMGTAKYPKENEYSQYLSKHGGHSNAFTSTENTNYYFEVAHPYLEGALDRFAQFFIAPLFDDSCTERELNAVDSENKKNLQADSWRLFQLDKATCRPGHPYTKFGTGNLETLKVTPAKAGVNVREQLLNFHAQYYSANIMRLVVLGREPLDVLQKWAVNLFEGISNKNVPIPCSSIATDVLSAGEFGKLVKARPIKDLRSLDIAFEFPPQWSLWDTQPSRYLGHLLGHEGEGSLFAHLRKLGWANSLSAGASGQHTFGFFHVTVDLTEKGLENYREVVRLIFAYIRLLKQEGPQEWVFREVAQLAEIGFRFKEIGSPSAYASRLAGNLHIDYPPERVLNGGSLPKRFDAASIKEHLQCLDPSRFRAVLVSRSFTPEEVPLREQWYETEYGVEDFPQDFIASLALAPIPQQLHLPKPNPFIPENLDAAKPNPEKVNGTPKMVHDADGMRLWYRQDQQFGVPKSFVYLKFKSPLAYGTPRQAILTRLYCDILKDVLSEYSYDAEVAGLMYSLDLHTDGFKLSLSGYSDKMPVLALKVAEKMKPLQVDPERFAVLKELVERNYRNWDMEPPYTHAMYYLSYSLAESLWSTSEKLQEIQDITARELERFALDLMKGLHVEGLLTGSMPCETYLSMVRGVRQALGYNALRPSQLIKPRTAMLPTECNFVYQTTVADPANVNSAIEYFCQITALSEVQLRARLALVGQIAHEPCFDQLRTKEQLGYMVFSGELRQATMTGFRVLIQSERDTVYLEQRIESFLRQFGDLLKSISDKDYEQNVEALVTKKLEKDKNLYQQSQRFWRHIGSGYYDFDQVQLDVAELKGITKPDLIKFYDTYIHPSSATRRKFSVHLRSQQYAQHPHINLLHACLSHAGFAAGTAMQTVAALSAGNNTSATGLSLFDQLQSTLQAGANITEQMLETLVHQLKAAMGNTGETSSTSGSTTALASHDQLLQDLRRAFGVSASTEEGVTNLTELDSGAADTAAKAAEKKSQHSVAQYSLPTAVQRVDDLVAFRASLPLSPAPRPVSGSIVDPKARM
ncbi:metalloprotease [Sorochytrium milnesiophthora]